MTTPARETEIGTAAAGSGSTSRPARSGGSLRRRRGAADDRLPDPRRRLAHAGGRGDRRRAQRRQYGCRRRFRTLDGALRAEPSSSRRDEDGRRRGSRRASSWSPSGTSRSTGRASSCCTRSPASPGTPVEVAHSDGSTETTRVSRADRAGAAGLRHRRAAAPGRAGRRSTIAMEGEVFEMEDQRNWTDASFKTYCRPLARPRPYRLAAGETVRQRIVVTLTRGASRGRRRRRRPPPRRPRGRRAITLAHEPALGGTPPDGARAARGRRRAAPRRRGDAADREPLPLRAPVTLEIVTGADAAARPRGGSTAACAAAGLLPARVVALPRALSRQPPAGRALAGRAGADGSGARWRGRPFPRPRSAAGC